MRHRLLLILCCLSAAFGSSRALAQQASPQDAARAPAAPALTLERLEALWASAGASLSPEAIEALRPEYERARALLEEARANEAEASRLDQERAEAASLLESVRAELAQPVAERALDLPEQPTVEQVQQALSAAQAELSAAQQRVRDLEAEQARRSARREALPGEIAATRRLLEEHSEQSPVAGEEQPSEAAALARAAHDARRRMLESRLRRLEAEQAHLDARREVLPARRDRAVRRVNELERLVERAQRRLEEARRSEAQRRQREAQQALREAAGASDAVRAIAERNAEIAALRTGADGITARLAGVEQRLAADAGALNRVQENFARVRSIVSDIGLTNAVGVMLRTFRAGLPNLDALSRRIQSRQAEISAALFTLYELEQNRRDLADLEQRVARAVEAHAEEAPEASEAEREAVAAAVRQLLQDRRALLDEVVRDYQVYRETLLSLDATQRRLREAARAFADYIDERVLWIASAPPVGAGDLHAAVDRLAWSFHPRVWADGGRALLADWRRAPLRPAGAGAIFVGFLVLCRRLRRAGERTGRAEAGPLRGALTGASMAALSAARWPLAFLLLAWLLRAGAAEPGAPAVRMSVFADALGQTAILLLLLRFLSIICKPGGYAIKRLRWRESAAGVVRAELRWFTPLATIVSLVSLSAPLEIGDPGAGAPDPTPVKRLAMTIFMLAASLLLWRIFRPRGAVMSQIRMAARGGWLDRLRGAWLLLLVGAPLALGALALLGYVYTSVELGRRLVGSMFALAAVVIVQNALTQWLVAARRTLELEQARRRREAAEQTPEDAVGGEGSVRPAEETDLATLDAQTRRLFRSGTALTAAIALWLIWSSAAPALRMLERVELYPNFGAVAGAEALAPPPANALVPDDGAPATDTSADPGAQAAPAPSGTIGQGPVGDLMRTAEGRSGAPAQEADAQRVSLAQALLAVFVGLIAYIATRNLPGLLEITLLQRLEMDNGLRVAITTLSRYLIAVVGVLLVFSLAGIGWSKVQWLAAALTFGLAFGLQEIFANFVSGLIILLERPIRIGDTVTVGDVSGEVSQIRFRATTITDWDRKELVVPNKEFITTRLVNWTLTDPVTRIKIPVGVAYGSDVRTATEILLRVAREHPSVLDDPPPQALFLGFGDNALSLELRVHIPHMRHFIEVRDGMHRAIDDAFREAGVEIAFPQRDLHLRSVSEKAVASLSTRFGGGGREESPPADES